MDGNHLNHMIIYWKRPQKYHLKLSQVTANGWVVKHIVKVLMNLLALPLVVRKTNNTLGYRP